MLPHCIVLQGLARNLHHLSYMYFCLFSTQKHSMKKLHFTLKHYYVEQCDEMRHRRSYTPVNSWSTGMIAFYAETDISILSPKRWLIWKPECHQWWSIRMWKITGNVTRPAEMPLTQACFTNQHRTPGSSSSDGSQLIIPYRWLMKSVRVVMDI